MNDMALASNPPGEAPEKGAEQERIVQVRLTFAADKPWVTYAILTINVLMFILQIASQFIFAGIDFPAILGMKINEAIVEGQYWRLITPVFLHGSLMHIGFNTYAIYIFGRGLERHYGHWRYFLLYLLGALGGNVFSFIFSPNPSLGASTAVFGLVAAEGVFIYRNRFLFGGQARSMLINILTVVAINLALGLSPGIDNWGHLGGLAAGLAFAWFSGPVLKIDRQDGEYVFSDRKTNTWQVGLMMFILLVTLALTRAIFVK